MKKIITCFVALSVCFLLFNTGVAFGQEKEEVRHIFTISTWKAGPCLRTEAPRKEIR